MITELCLRRLIMDKKVESKGKDTRGKETPEQTKRRAHNQAPAHRASTHLVHTDAKRKA